MTAGPVVTTAELIASVEANSKPNICSLDHPGDADPRHKEPTPPATDPGWIGTREILHIQYPDGTWRTTLIAIL